MKKSFNQVLHTFFVCMLTLLLGACGDKSSDNEPDYPGNNNAGGSSSLTNTCWYNISTDYELDIEDLEFIEYYDLVEIYFLNSTEGLVHYRSRTKTNGSSDGVWERVAHFTYTLKDTKISLKYVTDKIRFFDETALEYSNGRLSTVGGIMKFKSSKMTSDDRELINSVCGTTGDCRWYSNYYDSFWVIGDGKMADYSSANQAPWRNVGVVEFIGDITHIGAYAFAGTLATISSLPKSLESIGDYAFYECSFSKLNLQDTKVKTIGDFAFYGCSAYGSLYFPSTIERIGDNAFWENSNMNIFLDNTPKLQSIGELAFQSEVRSFTDSEVLTEIGQYAFYKYAPKTIRLPNSLRSIGPFAFMGSFNKVTIGPNLTSILGRTFSTTVKNGSLYINQAKPLSLSYSLIDKDDSWTLYVPKGAKSAYSSAPYWKDFKYIYEDSSLDGQTGSGSSPGDSSGQDNDSESGTINGHAYVDLGLSVKWATTNVGAESPSDYGDYFAWGETAPKSSYTESNSKWDGVSESSLKSQGIIDSKGNLTSKYDAATANWGSKWRMPTLDEFKELLNECTWLESTQGSHMYLIIGPNGNYIALPAAGYRNGDDIKSGDCFYWTATVSSDSGYGDYVYAKSIYIFSYSYMSTGRSRYEGQSVRPVTE